MTYEIEESESIDRSVQKALEDGLAAHNIPFAGEPDWRTLQLVIRDDDGNLAGGLTGESLNRMFKVKLLWVRDDMRGTGIGRQLMEQAERVARSRGDTGMLVSTYTYQGPEFYKKMGFEVFGIVKDYPQGYDCECMMKRF